MLYRVGDVILDRLQLRRVGHRPDIGAAQTVWSSHCDLLEPLTQAADEGVVHRSLDIDPFDRCAGLAGVEQGPA
jgi:hypothetical protein